MNHNKISTYINKNKNQKKATKNKTIQQKKQKQTAIYSQTYKFSNQYLTIVICIWTTPTI